MEKENYCEKDSSKYVTTEKVLPSLIKVEETNCLLCGRIRKFYVCRQCNDLGNLIFLVQLPNENPEKTDKRFTGFISGETKRKVVELQEELKTTAQALENTTKASTTKEKKNKVLSSIIQTRKRIEVLKYVKKLQTEEMRTLQWGRKSIETTIEQLHRRIQRVQMKKTKITEYMSTKKTAICKTRATLNLEKKQLHQMQKQQILELVTNIFPIVGLSQDETLDSTEKSSAQEINEEDDVNLIEEALTEARRLSFVHGRWIYDQGEGPDLVRISISSNKACAPADGDYSACEAWLKLLLASAVLAPDAALDASSLSTSDPIEPHTSPGASIYASLYLATQLMHTVRRILSIHLPYKHHYRQFNNPNMTIQEFRWNVRRLNGNILAVCLEYGVEPHLIHPLHTLPNLQNAIQMFLHNSDRVVSEYFSLDLIKSIEEALNDSSDPLPDDDEDKMEESLSEWEHSLADEDWEALSPKLSQDLQHPQYTSAVPFQSQAHPEDMGASQGLVSSAVAWVTKGWWNR